MPVDARIPDKQYFRIGEVASIAEVEAYVLRFWETEFSTLKPGKTRTGRRQYSRKDVEHVLRIRDLLYEERFTIEGARRQLKRSRTGTPAEVPARVKGTMKRLRNDVQELLQLVEE